MTPDFDDALHRMAEELNVAPADVIRKAVNLLRVALDAKREGKRLLIADDQSEQDIVGLLGCGMNQFYNGLSLLFDAIDALMAYDCGARDSGASDEALRTSVREYLESLDDHEFRKTCAQYAKRFLTDEAIAQGFGLKDVLGFAEWLADQGYKSNVTHINDMLQ